jgi:hypothetical protein
MERIEARTHTTKLNSLTMKISTQITPISGGTRLNGVNRPDNSLTHPFNSLQTPFFNSVTRLTDLITKYSVTRLGAYI